MEGLPNDAPQPCRVLRRPPFTRRSRVARLHRPNQLPTEGRGCPEGNVQRGWTHRCSRAADPAWNLWLRQDPDRTRCRMPIALGRVVGRGRTTTADHLSQAPPLELRGTGQVVVSGIEGGPAATGAAHTARWTFRVERPVTNSADASGPQVLSDRALTTAGQLPRHATGSWTQLLATTEHGAPSR